MGQVVNSSNLKFIFLFLTISFTAFEFFFRDGVPYVLLSMFMLLLTINRIFYISNNIRTLFLMLFLIFLLQSAFLVDYSVLGCFTRMLLWVSSLSLAFIIDFNYKKYFVAIISFIAIYSLVIYFISYIPIIREFLIYKVCPMFPSLNLENAIQEGGGDNFVIYNFQKDYLNEAIGFYRNCGPFWEPGMFACFLNLALFINLNFDGNKWTTVLLVLTSITTFSTGGLICLLFIIFSYVQLNAKNNIILYILGIALLVTVFIFFYNTSFIGLKILNQLDNASIGSDQSRFGAILTQIKMIEESVLIGGEKIKDYTDSGTLASSLLLPFVNFGILVGGYFYILLYKSCINNSYLWGKNKKHGVYLFLLILLMSLSQAIILTPFILSLMFCGLFKKSHLSKLTFV